MKNIVVNDTGREVEFKPNALFDEYLRLTEKDLKSSLKSLSPGDCPACQSNRQEKVFEKFGFAYVECQACGTVCMSPAPDDETIRKHYLASGSVRFWRENLARATEDKRIEKIYAPRMQWIIDMTQEYLPQARNIAVINEKNQAFVEGLARSSHFERKIAVNPYFKAKNISGVEVLPRGTDKSADVALAFETIDYAGDVDKVLDSIKNILVPGGLCFVTTISISGFDLQVLWDNSKTIFPLDRIKVFSTKGLRTLFKRHGLEILEYSTPGLLDLDVVKNAVERGVPVPRFVKNLVEQGNDQVFKDFQEFLQINKLSSFVRVLLRKGD
jgi:SAM-dependent methyltransferase